MKNSSPLYHALSNLAGSSLPGLGSPHPLKTCVAIVAAMIYATEVNLNNVRLHKEQSYGSVHVAVGRNNVNGEFWAIVSDEPTSLQTFSQYGLHFCIEESFLDEQSNGWQVQSSRIRTCCALSRFWFLLAVATLYLSAQGVAVVAQGRRRWVDAHWFRGSSYLRLGWDWVRAAAFNGWRLIRSVSFTGNRDPMPAMASHKQHQWRLYRLEFQVQTFRYLPD